MCVCVFENGYTGKLDWGVVSAARAPVTGTFSIRFELPPALKSGRLYILLGMPSSLLLLRG